MYKRWPELLVFGIAAASVAVLAGVLFVVLRPVVLVRDALRRLRLRRRYRAVPLR